MIRVAVTGGIACGKSLAASMMEAAGVSVCDADTIAHRLIEPGTAVYRDVVTAFGPCVLTDEGAIDRRTLGNIVFNDSESRFRLNAIIHPVVRQAISDWMDQCEHEGVRVAVAVIPLLFEAEMSDGWDLVVCVACQPTTQLDRLRKRGLDLADCQARVDAQMPLEDKVRRSDLTIWNDGSPDELSESVSQVLKRIEEKIGDGRDE